MGLKVIIKNELGEQITAYCSLGKAMNGIRLFKRLDGKSWRFETIVPVLFANELKIREIAVRGDWDGVQPVFQFLYTNLKSSFSNIGWEIVDIFEENQIV